MKKECTICGLKKQENDFYKRKSGGIYYQCKLCSIKKRSAYYKLHQKEIYEYQKAWRLKNPEIVKAIAKKANKKCYAKAGKKHSVRSLVRKQILIGKMERPKTCSRCKSGRHTIHGHHPDYQKPLAVIWLCPKCHKQQHKKENEQ